MIRMVLLPLGVLLTGLLIGCGSAGTPTLGHTPDTEGRLREVGAMYQEYLKARKATPRKMTDLERYEPANQHGYMSLREGEIVVFWGGSVPGPNAGNVVLAHEKKVPQEGGLVLMQDGNVKTMTAAEFKAAPKAGR